MTAEDLARYVRDRRAALEMSQADIAAVGGPSTETMRLVENARRPTYGNATLNRLDKALNWEPGSARRALLAGQPPIPRRVPRPAHDSDQLALHIGRTVLALIANAKERS